MIAFDSKTGYLPAGVHTMSWLAFRSAFGWNARRRFLMTGLRRAVIALRHAGCRSVLVDGSFVTSKELPGDYDMAFDPNGMESARLDPLLLRHDDGRKAMKAKYLGDIFPSGAVASATTGAVYTQFFQHDRSGMPKGIVELFPGELT